VKGPLSASAHGPQPLELRRHSYSCPWQCLRSLTSWHYAPSFAPETMSHSSSFSALGLCVGAWDFTKALQRRPMTASAWKAVEQLQVEPTVPLVHRGGSETLRGCGYASRRSSIVKLDRRPMPENSPSQVLFRCRSICGEQE
jgi:hypothetical protein